MVLRITYYGGCVTSSVTVTARIPKELKEALSRYGVNVSKVVRRALEEEARQRRHQELKGAAEDLGEFFAGISKEELAKSVRETREAR